MVWKIMQYCIYFYMNFVWNDKWVSSIRLVYISISNKSVNSSTLAVPAAGKAQILSRLFQSFQNFIQHSFQLQYTFVANNYIFILIIFTIWILQFLFSYRFKYCNSNVLPVYLTVKNTNLLYYYLLFNIILLYMYLQYNKL